MTQSPPTVIAAKNVPAATVGFLQGTKLFLAGTPANPSCDPTSSLCGAITILDLSFGLTGVDCTTSTNCQILAATNGRHDHMEMGAHGQLFIGARTCTSVAASGSTPGRGCLSILNTTSSPAVTTPQISGDVTGIAPISNRNVVYVCQGGVLSIYDTTTGALQTNPAQPNIVGQAIDVKVADF